MNRGRALAIFENIENAKENENEKALAIRIVLDMETHNSVKKSSMLKVIEYLWSHLYYMEGDKNERSNQQTGIM
jgi:hypothetical protein